MIVDVHAHLELLPKEKLDSVLTRAKDNNVSIIVQNGIDSESNRFSLDISKKYNFIKPALGIYPTNINENFSSEIEFISKSSCIAIGEVGLDYKEENYNSKLQKEIFQSLIDISKKKSVPIIIHSRKAELDCIEMLESSSIKNSKVIMHCFSGNFKLVRRIRDNGWNFSIPANVLYNEHFQKLVSEVNLSQLYTETDTPFLSPFRTNQKLISSDSEFDINEPSNIKFSIKKIAEIKKMDPIEVENILYMNYKKNFE